MTCWAYGASEWQSLTLKPDLSGCKTHTELPMCQCYDLEVFEEKNFYFLF